MYTHTLTHSVFPPPSTVPSVSSPLEADTFERHLICLMEEEENRGMRSRGFLRKKFWNTRYKRMSHQSSHESPAVSGLPRSFFF